MKTSLVLLATVLGSTLVLTGCTNRLLEEKQYDIQGKVVAVDPAKPVVTLDHEDIPGLMKAMKMDFSVENAAILEGLKAGDQVQGRLKKRESGYIITQLAKR